MSAIATTLNRPVRFYEAAAGKKAVMAVTGVILFGYVLAHMLGNLQIFEGPDAINSYAHFLHSHEGALWVARVVLLLAVVLHIVASVQLWVLNNKARPVSYVRKADVPTLVRCPHHEVERPHHRGVRDFPRAAPDHRRYLAAAGRPVDSTTSTTT